MSQDRNPFTDAYVKEEAAFFGQHTYDKDGVVLHYVTPNGRLDDYLNKAWAIGDITVPQLRIDGQTWMSLTRLECQSQHLPIMFAAGQVATVGLGLGHFTLRAMQKPSVDKVTVFEKDPRVVEYFTHLFSILDGFEKVEVVLGDARELCRGYSFDFLYVDCYPTMCGDEVIEDAKAFVENNDLTNGSTSYHFWGMERVLLEAVMLELIDLPWLDHPLEEYMRVWFNTPIENIDGDQKLSGMFSHQLDREYIEKVLHALDMPFRGCHESSSGG